MARFPAFIEQIHLAPTITSTEVLWDGVVTCVDGIEIHVLKNMDVRLLNGRPQVRTRRYSYHVLVVEDGQSTALFRYDNAHEHPGHPDRHHKHERDASGAMVVVHVGEDGWPTLGDVIDEAERWWIARGSNGSQ